MIPSLVRATYISHTNKDKSYSVTKLFELQRDFPTNNRSPKWSCLLRATCRFYTYQHKPNSVSKLFEWHGDFHTNISRQYDYHALLRVPHRLPHYNGLWNHVTESLKILKAGPDLQQTSLLYPSFNLSTEEIWQWKTKQHFHPLILPLLHFSHYLRNDNRRIPNIFYHAFSSPNFSCSISFTTQGLLTEDNQTSFS